LYIRSLQAQAGVTGSEACIFGWNRQLTSAGGRDRIRSLYLSGGTSSLQAQVCVTGSEACVFGWNQQLQAPVRLT